MNISSSLPLASKILFPLETNVSAGMFLRDTGGCLLSRLAVSRSKDETREISFAELAESLIFYFSITPVAALASKLIGKTLKADKKYLARNIHELSKLNKNILDKVKLAKIGKIGLTFSLLLPAIYAIAPLRNILTESINGKNKFTSVVGLDQHHQHRRSLENKEQAHQKARQFIKKMLGYAAAGATLTAIFMAAHSIPALRNKIQPVTDGIIKHFDFKGKAGLTLKQLGFLIMPVSVKSYFDASRDKYEVFENIRRFSITIPMMFFGQDFIEKRIYKLFDKIYKSNLAQSSGITTYKDILKFPVKEQAASLKAKNWSITLAFMINTLGLALAVALLNRYSTKKNYQRETSLSALSLTSHQHINSVTAWQNTLHQRRSGRVPF